MDNVGGIDMVAATEFEKEESVEKSSDNKESSKQGFDEKKEWFSGLNWDAYFKEIPIPKPFAPCYDIAYDMIEEPLFPQFHPVADMRLLIQRDPDDYITFYSGGKEKANTFTWMYTLDYFLYLYMQLKIEYDNKYGPAKRVSFDIPNKLIEKYQNNSNRSKDRKKKLFIGLDYFENSQKFVTNENEVRERHFVPELGSAACMNFLCRSITTRPNSTKQFASLSYHSLVYTDPELPDLVPSFQIEDYFFHEFYTGISLSIEIAAVLLEVNQKIADADLWNKAFDEFCKKALPMVVQSSMFYARNSAARLFFQQILIEVSINKFMLDGSTEKVWENPKVWHRIIERATMHIQKLQQQPVDCPCIVDKKIVEYATNYLKGLVSQVESPCNIIKYAEAPTHGLAAFCNAQHSNVSFFLEEINRYLTTDKKYWPASSKESKESHAVFRKVYCEVKKAIDFWDNLKVFDSERKSERFCFSDINSSDILKSYSAFANADGGVIILARPIRQLYSSEMCSVKQAESGERGMLNQPATKIVDSFWDILNNSEKVSKNIIEKDDIQIKEIDNEELIAVWVPPKKRTSSEICVGDKSKQVAYWREGNANILYEDMKKRKADIKSANKRNKSN